MSDRPRPAYGSPDADHALSDEDELRRDVIAVKAMSDELGRDGDLGRIRRKARELRLSWSQRMLAIWAHGRLLEQE